MENIKTIVNKMFQPNIVNDEIEYERIADNIVEVELTDKMSLGKYISSKLIQTFLKEHRHITMPVTGFSRFTLCSQIDQIVNINIYQQYGVMIQDNRGEFPKYDRKTRKILSINNVALTANSNTIIPVINQFHPIIFGHGDIMIEIVDEKGEKNISNVFCAPIIFYNHKVHDHLAKNNTICISYKGSTLYMINEKNTYIYHIKRENDGSFNVKNV